VDVGSACVYNRQFPSLTVLVYTVQEAFASLPLLT